MNPDTEEQDAKYLYRLTEHGAWECKLCGAVIHSGIGRDNHARKHEREGTVVITGFGGPDGARRFEVVKNRQGAGVGLTMAALGWKVNTSGLLKEIMANQGAAILARPLQIFGMTLADVATRASQLNDPIMNDLMSRLALYEVCDPYSQEYDPEVVRQIEERAAIEKAKGETA